MVFLKFKLAEARGHVKQNRFLARKLREGNEKLQNEISQLLLDCNDASVRLQILTDIRNNNLSILVAKKGEIALKLEAYDNETENEIDIQSDSQISHITNRGNNSLLEDFKNHLSSLNCLFSVFKFYTVFSCNICLVEDNQSLHGVKFILLLVIIVCRNSWI